MDDYEKALRIFGLAPNFTEEQLKSSHRRLSRMYHPDKYKEGTELHLQMQRKQQEINAARDYLKNYVNTPNTSKKGFSIDEYIREKINNLEKIIKDNGQPILDEDYKEIFNKIKSIINTFKAYVFISFILTKQDVDSMYASCMISIRMILESFVTSFYQKNYIDESDVKEQINYDCDLKSFYNQLLKIKEKYSKEEKIKKRLEEEIEGYKGYAGYEQLEILVNLCKKNTLYYIKQNNFQNIEEEINKMHQTIIIEVFEAFYSLKKKISELGNIINTINDEQIKNEYLNVSHSFENGCSFFDTEESIKRLEELIQKYQELELKKSRYQENETAINQIYQSLITRYSEEIKKYNILSEYESIKNLNEFLNKILQVFIKGCEELKELEYFNAFNNITFTNMAVDNEIIQSLKQNKSNVYVKIRDTYMFDDTSFFFFDEENMIMYKIDHSSITSKKITKEQLEEEYIPIETVLESSIFVGKYMSEVSLPIRVLYESDRVVICYRNQKFNVSNKQKFYDSSIHSASNRPTDDSFEPFKDKQYVCEMIEKQVKGSIEEYKKNQSQASNQYSPNSKIYGQTSFNTDDGYYYDECGNKRRK